MTRTDKVERVTAGERLQVDPDAIERELAEVWREAGRSAEGRRPVTRACLWNVVFCLDARADQEADGPPRWLEATIRELPTHLASRALVLRARPAAPEAPELRSWISANCILGSGGGKMVCSEEVSLETHGEGWRHLPGLVRALLVPGVPTAVVFGDVPDPEGPLPSALFEAADRVVVRADRFRGAHPFDLARRVGERRSLVDLGWAAQADLRSAIAALFDGAEADATRIRRVTAFASPGEETCARLALGWVLARLGARGEVLGSLGGGGATVETRVGPVDLGLERDDTHGDRGGHDRFGLRFLADGVERSVEREEGGGLCLRRPSGCRRWSNAEPDGAELLARALLHRGDDAELVEALAWAEALP